MVRLLTNLEPSDNKPIHRSLVIERDARLGLYKRRANLVRPLIESRDYNLKKNSRDHSPLWRCKTSVETATALYL